MSLSADRSFAVAEYNPAIFFVGDAAASLTGNIEYIDADCHIMS